MSALACAISLMAVFSVVSAISAVVVNVRAAQRLRRSVP